MKNKKIKDNTVSNKIYKSCSKTLNGLCNYCKPHRGCNRNHYAKERSWKQFRKFQWKE